MCWRSGGEKLRISDCCSLLRREVYIYASIILAASLMIAALWSIPLLSSDADASDKRSEAKKKAADKLREKASQSNNEKVKDKLNSAAERISPSDNSHK